MQTIIISLGGSIISPKRSEDVERAEALTTAYIAWLHQLAQTAVVAVIVGGGNTARVNIEQAQQANAAITPEQLDLIGIAATRQNANMLKAKAGVMTTLIDDPHMVLPTTPSLIFGCGWKPGRSTDYCAVQLAVSNQVEMIYNISNITYLYTQDPTIYPNATKITDTTWEALRAIVGNDWHPGLNTPFDPIAAQLAQAERKTVKIVNGWNLTNVQQAVAGEQFEGTTVHP